MQNLTEMCLDHSVRKLNLSTFAVRLKTSPVRCRELFLPGGPPHTLQDVNDTDVTWLALSVMYVTAYPVKVFDGHKTMILATTSWIGGNNAFLSNAYLWFGVCCVLFSLLLAAVHTKFAFRSAVRVLS